MERALKITLSFALLGFTGSSVLGDCKCARPLEGETTHWGGNMSIELDPKATLKVQGRVESVGKPLRSLPFGRYEIRSSIDTGWDMTHVVVTVDTKNGKNRKTSSPNARSEPRKPRIAGGQTA
jgi:hypothetical protein